MKLIVDKFYAIYLVLNKEMAQKSHLRQMLLKSASKTWKPTMIGWLDAGNILKTWII